MKIDIDFTRFQDSLQLKKEGQKTLLFDPIRKMHVVLAPEELVRQLLVHYLMQERHFPKSRIRIEQGLKVNTLSKRCDVLIYNQHMAPTLLVECKAPKVRIDDKTFEQIARYNLPLKVAYLIVTNGIDTYCSKMDYTEQKYTFLGKIPSWKEI